MLNYSSTNACSVDMRSIPKYFINKFLTLVDVSVDLLQLTGFHISIRVHTADGLACQIESVVTGQFLAPVKCVHCRRPTRDRQTSSRPLWMLNGRGGVGRNGRGQAKNQSEWCIASLVGKPTS